MKKLLFAFVVLISSWAISAQPIPIPRRVAPEKTPAIHGFLKVSQIDSQNLCLTGYYQDFLIERFVEECGPFLKLLEQPQYKPQDWSWRFNYNFAGASIIEAYRPIISKAYQNQDGFKITDSAGKSIPIAKSGYWINPVSAARFPNMITSEEVITHNAEVTHHAYFELAAQMTENEVYTITNALGESIQFKYSSKSCSAAIKVNQVGYSPQAGRKYGYLGLWRGPELGARNYDNYIGKPFSIVDYSTQKSVYEGTITARTVTDVQLPQYSGEKVYDLDFSDFSLPGRYQITIDGIGSSLPFELGNQAIGEAFYVRMRGMYHKRCGTIIKQPYSAWESYIPEEYLKTNPHPEGCHRITYEGNFPPNIRHYGGRGDAGFFDKDGKKYDVNSFTLIHNYSKTDKVLPNVWGGWHDAADYDRRPFHLECVGDFIAAYLMCPDNFTDNQLNIPESGNSIPDILDEAIWGTMVWLKAQNDKGGVGCWIEADGHPGNYVPVTDQHPYFLALPTMESTANYAGYAASLAWALKKAGANKESKRFMDSAIKAYQYATDTKNRVVVEYKDYPAKVNGKVTPVDLTYRESEQLSGTELGKAAFNLYLLTGDKKYVDEFNRFRPLGFDRYLADLSWKGSPMYLAEFLIEGKDKPEFAEVYSKICKAALDLADTRLEELNNNYQYRMPWYAKNHAYVSHTSWGNFQPLNRARAFIPAWIISRDKKYRDAAFLCSDWELGCNPTNSSMTTGLGVNYPARYLDLPSYSDHIVEFVPGITPYRNTYGIARPAIEMAWGLSYAPRKDHKFDGMSISLLPKSIYPHDTIEDINKYAKLVGNNLPIWRRFANVEGWSVAASEYTVSETLGTQAAITGCLLQPGWKPTEAQKTKKPVSDLKRIPGLTALP